MVQCYFLTMRKIVVTFTIALSLGAASTIANAQPAAPATNASAAASTTAAANNNQTTAAKTSTPAAAQSSAAASSSAPAVVPPKGDNKSDKDPSTDKDKQSNKDKSGQNKKSGNNVGSTLGIIAAIAAVLGLVGGGIFWAIQQNLIPNIQLPNIPGLPTNIPNPFAPPAPAPAPAPTSSAAPAPAE